jgi:hypothetical protein
MKHARLLEAAAVYNYRALELQERMERWSTMRK